MGEITREQVELAIGKPQEIDYRELGADWYSTAPDYVRKAHDDGDWDDQHAALERWLATFPTPTTGEPKFKVGDVVRDDLLERHLTVCFLDMDALQAFESGLAPALDAPSSTTPTVTPGHPIDFDGVMLRQCAADMTSRDGTIDALAVMAGETPKSRDAGKPETWHEKLVRLAREAADRRSVYETAAKAEEDAAQFATDAHKAMREAERAFAEASEASAILAEAMLSGREVAGRHEHVRPAAMPRVMRPDSNSVPVWTEEQYAEWLTSVGACRSDVAAEVAKRQFNPPPVTVMQAPAILYTPEGIPYSTDPDIMAALDLRHRIGSAEGAEHVAMVLGEGFMGEQHELGPEQEDGYQHAASDAHEAARGVRARVTKS